MTITFERKTIGSRLETVYTITINENFVGKEFTNKFRAHSVHECKTALEHYFMATHDGRDQDCPICRQAGSN